MKTLIPCILLIVSVLQVSLMATPLLAANKDDPIHQAVLDLKPVGFWPADDGVGEVLRDHSGNDNHGRLLEVPWGENGLLNFTGAYQWAEIPDHPRYQSRTFTIGGWVFNRKAIRGGGWPGTEGMLFFGNAYHRSGYTLETLHDSPTLYRKSEWGIAGGSPGGVNVSLRRDGLVDVTSGGGGDAMGTRADGMAIAIGQWQHVLYTYEAGMPVPGGPQWQALQDWTESYEAGTGKLYMNGQLVQSKAGVPFKRRDMRFLIGNDAYWWLQANESGSLDGSISNMVMFDRALTAPQVKELLEASRPTVEPRMFAADAIIVDGRQITLEELSAASEDDRRRGLEQLESRKPEELQPMAQELEPILAMGLKSPRTCRVAASLLAKLDTDQSNEVLAQAVPALVLAIQDENRSRDERVESVLALTEIGAMARDAVAPLVAVLAGIDKRQGVRLPRVEDLLRNSVMRALLDIDPDDEGALAALGSALARPIFDSLDLSPSYLDDVRPLVKAGRYSEAMDIYRALPLKEHNDRFISQGDPHRDNRATSGNIRAYTATAEYEDHTYRLGKGESFDAVDAVSAAEFEAQVAKLELEYPEARDWMKGDTPRLSRVKIFKTDAAGNEQTTFLEGEHFIFDGRDAKVRGWSIAFDRDGYIHITGGIHNAPHNAQYIPGSWEGMGASRDHTNDSYPTLLYWVSRNPGDIESLEFVGQRDNPRNAPTPLGMCYMNFIQDRERVLYLYGRVHVQGIQSWGLYRYDASAKRWSGVGGYAPNVLEEFPEWADQNIEMSADWLSLATFRWKNTAPQNQVLAWARQPHFYNYIRSWGVKFDRTNRMHVQLGLFGFDRQNRNVNSELYAYSDDGGESFHRADGEKLGLPLTVTPGETGYAAMHSDSSGRWWNLWLSLLQYAGYQ
jgi:hypothetical protein